MHNAEKGSMGVVHPAILFCVMVLWWGGGGLVGCPPLSSYSLSPRPFFFFFAVLCSVRSKA